jgi:hypothetical protein
MGQNFKNKPDRNQRRLKIFIPEPDEFFFAAGFFAGCGIAPKSWFFVGCSADTGAAEKKNDRGKNKLFNHNFKTSFITKLIPAETASVRKRSN